MGKKYRFKPTREMKWFIHPELVKRDGEISEMWAPELISLFPDSFEEIGDCPVSFNEFFSAFVTNIPKEMVREIWDKSEINERKRTQPVIDPVKEWVEFVNREGLANIHYEQHLTYAMQMEKALKTLEDNQ